MLSKGGDTERVAFLRASPCVTAANEVADLVEVAHWDIPGRSSASPGPLGQLVTLVQGAPLGDPEPPSSLRFSSLPPGHRRLMSRTEWSAQL